MEAVKQGSAAVGLRSKTHAILLTLKVWDGAYLRNIKYLIHVLYQRSTGELASYQNKMNRIDDHVGIAFAGLTSDARVLRYSLLYVRFKILDLPPHQQFYASTSHALSNDV